MAQQPHNNGKTPKTQGALREVDAVKAPFDAHAVQRHWLCEALGRTVRLRLIDGRSIAGRLIAFDTYTLSVQVGGEAPHLVFKQSLAYVTRGDHAEVAS